MYFPLNSDTVYLPIRSWEERGRENKTQQPQLKPGSPPITLEVRGRNNRDKHNIIPEFKIQIKSITWLEFGRQQLFVGGNGGQQKTSSSCFACLKEKPHSNMNIKEIRVSSKNAKKDMVLKESLSIE